jgi:hypothetical protein
MLVNKLVAINSTPLHRWLVDEHTHREVV